MSMLTAVSSMPFKSLQKMSRINAGSCINMVWDSGYRSFIAYTRLGPVFEPELPIIAKRFRKSK